MVSRIDYAGVELRLLLILVENLGRKAFFECSDTCGTQFPQEMNDDNIPKANLPNVIHRLH